MSEIILNWCPPAKIEIPSPALSALKSYLLKHNQCVNIVYWNLRLYSLQCDFLWNNRKYIDDYGFILYLLYISVKRKNMQVYDYLKYGLKALNPEYLLNQNYYDEYISEYVNRLDSMIDDIVRENDPVSNKIWGFSLRFDQWIMASVIAGKVKEKNPDSIILVGGINTKDAARAFLNNFDVFDIAIWGEGEISLLKLKENIDNHSLNLQIDKIPNIAYRKDGVVKMTKDFFEYPDMTCDFDFLNFDDYYKQRNQCEIYTEVWLPVEGSRGCHWNKCQFCYLNDGYKYRRKSVERIADEINCMISKYNIKTFEFLDNDLVGASLERFNTLLDKFIEIRGVYKDFNIVMSEVVTKGLDQSIICKMAKAGFSYVQIGYESLSDTLLRKIKKKNTFSSNLLFIKFANYYGISIVGANILLDLLDETDEDIFESFDNFVCLRFFLSSNSFKHFFVKTSVNKSSRYYDKIVSFNKYYEPIEAQIISLYDLMGNDDNIVLFDYERKTQNKRWDLLRTLEKYYLKNKYEYKLVRNLTSILYEEYVNKRKTNSCVFNISSLEYKILFKANSSVISFNDLVDTGNNLNEEVSNCLVKLKQLGLIYYSDDFKEIVSVINMDKIDD